MIFVLEPVFVVGLADENLFDLERNLSGEALLKGGRLPGFPELG
jgi:hypothetical protein